MIFTPRTILLKNGVSAMLRSPLPADSDGMMAYLRICASETEFLLRYPEECTETPEQEKAYLADMADSETSLMIVCVIGGRIVGSCLLALNLRLKMRHRASVSVGILKEFWGLGIATALFAAMTETARQHGVSQLELEFIEGNDRAERLYRGLGFEIVGMHPNAIRLRDGTLLREYSMIKPL